MNSEKMQMQLVKAVQSAKVAEIQELLKKKAPVDAKDSRGRTALLIATENNEIEIARLLIEAGADVNIQDDKLDSPLLFAGAGGRLEILKMILKAKPNFKIYNRYGGTALIPANIKIPDHDGVTPLEHAQRRGYKEIVKLLE